MLRIVESHHREKPTSITGLKAAKLGAKIGAISVVPASIAGTGVAIATTGTVTSIKMLAGGLVAGAATFVACTGAGVAIGAGVGVVAGALWTVYRKRNREREQTMLINKTDVDL